MKPQINLRRILLSLKKVYLPIHVYKVYISAKAVLFALFLSLSLVLSSCSTLSRKMLKIESEPTGATVETLEGKVLGTTPLELKSEVISQISKNDYLTFHIRKDGFVSKDVVSPAAGFDQFQIKLKPLSKTVVENYLVEEYNPEINALIQGLLTAHTLIITKNFSAAEKKLENLKKDHKNIAAIYSLEAYLKIKSGKKDEALSLVQYALSIDEKDELANRLRKIWIKQ